MAMSAAEHEAFPRNPRMSATAPLGQDGNSAIPGSMPIHKSVEPEDKAIADFNQVVALFKEKEYLKAEKLVAENLSGGEDGKDVSAMPNGDWAGTLGNLAKAYEVTGEFGRAEALYFRMLAWHEGQEQYRAGHFRAALHLFEHGLAYESIDDALWFLQSIKPEDKHTVEGVVGLLALNAPVASRAAVALWTLSLRPEHRAHVSTCGGLELIVKALGYHPENAEVQAAGCGVIRLLASGHELAAENRERLVGSLNAIDLLLAAMKLHRTEFEVQREACGALRIIADHPIGARRIVESDGIGLLLEAIHSCPQENVGSAACKALRALCDPSKVDAGHSKTTSSMRLLQEQRRGLERCVELMELHSKVGSVQQSLLGAAAIFADNKEVRTNSSEAVPLIIKAMRHFQGLLGLQRNAVGYLWRLTVGHKDEDDLCAKVAHCGGIGLICQAMKSFPHQRDLQRSACGALRNLACDDDAFKTLVVKAGGLPAIISAMRSHPLDAKLQEHAIGALKNLCDTIGRATLCARQGGVEAIVGALQKYQTVDGVVVQGCMVLCMFCDDFLIRQKIVLAGTRAVAKKISRNAFGEAQQWGVELLRELTKDDEA
jgi:tetratricopeptide (TPR) repeat protein